MKIQQRETLIIDDPKVIKLLKKGLIKKLLSCFTSAPKTASEISRTISFPKDKIYYHIKNLISLNILYVAEVESIKGIEQKKFFPVAKNIIFQDSVNKIPLIKNDRSVKRKASPVIRDITNPTPLESLHLERKILRRRTKDRRVSNQRAGLNRRIKNINNFKGNENRKFSKRRTITESRISLERREMFERRFDSQIGIKTADKFSSPQSIKKYIQYPISFKNSFMKMRGIKEAISFVYESNTVTVLHCNLSTSGFKIYSTNKYELPIVIKDYTIKTLPELITNIVSQLIPEKNKSSVYISIHSEKYQYEMAYVMVSGKNNKLFEKDLYKSLEKNFLLKKEDILTDYKKYLPNKNGKSTILYSSRKDFISDEINTLEESGINARYNTSIPKILFNIYTYYNLDQENKHSILIYMGNLKTHLIVVNKNQIIGSSDFPKGLTYFSNRLSEISTKKSTLKENNRDAMHYLSFYGIGTETSDIKILDGFPFEKAQSILQHLTVTFQHELLECLNLIFPTNEINELNTSIFSNAYICGPGSHIKNIDQFLSKSLMCEVQNLADNSLDQLKEGKLDKKGFITKLRKRQTFQKRNTSEVELKTIKNKIQHNQLAIETAKSPESAKYRLARLEIEKNTKLKSIDSATKILIGTAKEFKDFKNEFIDNQQTLNTDLHVVETQLNEQTEVLLSHYNESDKLKLKISEIDFDLDQNSDKNKKLKENYKNQYQSKIKVATNSRYKLVDQKENCETRIDEIEQLIIGKQDKLQGLNLKLDSGQNEITIYEYLKESIQNTANAFKRSFIDAAKTLEKISQKDLNTLNETSYLITQNTKRINSIKETFISVIKGEIILESSHFIDGEDGLGIRKNLISILGLVLDIPEAVNELKTFFSTIIKINEEQVKLISEEKDIELKIKKFKRSKKDLKQAYSILSNELNKYDKDVINKESRRKDLVEILLYVRDTVEILNEINHNNLLIKELNQQTRLGKNEIKDLEIEISNLKDAVELGENENEKIDVQIKRFNQKSISEINILEEELKESMSKEEMLIEEIEDQNYKIKEISGEVLNARNYTDQLEKKVIYNKEDIEDLNKDKIETSERYIVEENSLKLEYDKRISILDQKKRQKVAESEKTKDVTIKTFFQKEMITLKKKQKLINSSLVTLNREKNKAIIEKDKADKILTEKKKKKLPEISKLKQNISTLQKDLKRGRKIEEKLIFLENDRIKWDSLFEEEDVLHQNKIEILQKSIKRKESISYLTFVKAGLTRINKSGDAEQIAKSMASESIMLDLEEIKKEEDSFIRFKSRYDLFLKRYRKRHQEITAKIKPFGGREKVIRGKIKSAEIKIKSAEKIIKDLVNRLDQKNSLFVKTDSAMNKYIKEEKRGLENLKVQIDKIPEKESRARYDIDIKTAVKISVFEKEGTKLKKEYDTLLNHLNDQFKNEEIIIRTQKIENNILDEFQDLDETNSKIKVQEQAIKDLKSSISSNERKLQRQIKKVSQARIKIQTKEIENELYKDDFTLKKDLNTKNLLKEQSLLIEAVNKCDSLKEVLEQQNQEYEKSKTIVNTLKDKVSKLINETKNEVLLNLDSNTNIKKLNIDDQLQYLLQIEKDILRNIEQSENLIYSTNTTIDTKKREEVDIESTLNLTENDLNYLENDRQKIENLIKSNTKYLNDVKNDYLKNLNLILSIKDLYPPSKIMIVERISILHTLVGQKLKDSENINFEIDDLKTDLNNIKIEVALVDEELSKINKEMKQALEKSFYETDNQEDKLKWEFSDSKVGSYSNIAQLKMRSKELFNEVVNLEESIALLKHKESSLKNVISESEKLSKKKIRRMEEVCTKLELQITKEKNEILGIEKEVSELKNLAFNYGDRIEKLEKELKKYREQEVEYEIILEDLDRSINTIKERSDKLIEKSSSLINNTIDMDYMANLGLLMDPLSELNLLPESQKENENYFFANRIMQNVLIVFLFIFSISSLIQHNQIRPIENKLPIKKAELSLLNMRKDIKKVVESKNIAAERYSALINEDSRLSSEMILILKYLSNKVPKDFHITGLTLDKLQSNYMNSVASRKNKSSIIINIDGFFNKNLDRSSLMIENFRNDLDNSGHFKKIQLSEGDVIKKYRTAFNMSAIY